MLAGTAIEGRISIAPSAEEFKVVLLGVTESF